MNLSVAVGMNQDAVLCVVCATQRFVHDVVVVPARYLGDGLVTDWADASLFFPQVQKFPFSLQGLFHLYAQAFFKIDFPSRVIGITFPFDFLVLPVDGCSRGQAQPVHDGCPIFVFCCAEEAPVLVSESPKIAFLYPSLALLWMSPSCPSPQRFEDGGIYMDKGFLCSYVSVIVCPSPYFGIECCYQPVCRSLLIILDDFSDVRKERFHVFLRRGDNKLPVVLTCRLSQKVESFLNVRYSGFLFREFQPSLFEGSSVTRGLTSSSRTFFEMPVIMKSSA